MSAFKRKFRKLSDNIFLCPWYEMKYMLNLKENQPSYIWKTTKSTQEKIHFLSFNGIATIYKFYQ